MPETNFLKTIQNRAWALLPAKLEELSAFVERRLAGEKLEFPQAAAGRSGNKAEQAYQVKDGVAILPVYGVLDKRMNLLSRFSGGTSTELLAQDFTKALDDPKVQAILLDVDSPGGSVDGTKDLADLVLSARGVKPVVAYANGLMASAAYWIGSAAQAIVAPATAEVGSIGVALMHYDYSAADAAEGVKRTVITGGKYKRIASDEKPLSKEGEAYLQGMVDDYYQLFLEGVATQRGSDPETVHDKMADGRIFIGKKALKVGLIDQIGNFNDALVLARAKGEGMPKNIKKATLQAENPALYQEILDEGAAAVTLADLVAKQPEAAAQLRAEGVTQERERAVKILTRAGLKGISLQAIQEGFTYEAALESFLDHQDQVRVEVAKTLAESAPPVVGTTAPVVETFTADDPNLPIETRAKAEWDKDPKVQKEFSGDFTAYLAFRKNEESGNVKFRKHV